MIVTILCLFRVGLSSKFFLFCNYLAEEERADYFISLFLMLCGFSSLRCCGLVCGMLSVLSSFAIILLGKSADCFI